jgi:hypothetical protein
MNKVDKLIQNNLNPYTAVRVMFTSLEEELQLFQNKFQSIELKEDVIELEISSTECILLIRRKDLNILIQELKPFQNKLQIVNAINDLFELNNLIDLLNNLETNNDPEFNDEFFPGFVFPKEKAIEIIHSIFENNFNTNDVLELINNKGINSLNEFHKNLLK